MEWKDSIQDFVAFKALHPEKLGLKQLKNQLITKKHKATMNKLINNCQKSRALLKNK